MRRESETKAIVIKMLYKKNFLNQNKIRFLITCNLMIQTHPTILAIESSCDETSASVIRAGKVLNNVIASQEVHTKHGGVVPELASRAHQQNILRVVNEAMHQSGIKKEELNAIAFTR